ncbi:5-bromo-4-chloroindolyl phosphate hydrolysis family protein [Intestinimonas massiliensis (ex Afouda et al. 2020)]|uniref:5-bromo-4-chloroindolyl phosphate hydrolysis family protein n=1 Tax=Intestinimonas massiliensis (ex Afouda et al. 2020) TaxID=1673721 RepID=UPI0010303B58|nr:5-bromo-4-chloroindolyl phosphate hydrolysis family protein [Intestinimonas massiliensis (ex Afouda et al. 2020)]
MASYQNRNAPDSQDLVYWIVTIVLLISVWPIGLFLLLRKLLGGSRRRQAGTYQPPRQAAPGTQGMNRGRQGKPIDLNRGKGMMVAGIVIAIIFGIALVSGFPILAVGSGFLNALAVMSPITGFFLGGLALTWAGVRRNKQVKRFRKYLALIGRRESVSITTLAQAMPVSFRKACSDLQDMLDDGILETGYLDMSTGRLILSDEGLQDPPEEKEEEAPPEDAPLDMNDDNAVLNEIRRLNDDIDDEVMSRKIDRIGEITGKIFAFQKQHPNRAGQLRSFLNYYLPTTLKILKAYARMEEQGIEGENIRSAKERIEGMMDKVVDGFEKQLDKLFQDDAMDIATDVQVLEQMLEKDGLSGDGMTLGG